MPGTQTDPLSERLADWASALLQTPLPDAVAEATAERILDTLGVGSAGSRTAFGRTLAAALAPLPARNEPAGAQARAFVDAALASSLDFDDTHRRTLIHPTTPTLHAAWQAATLVPCDGRTFLAAVAAGNEIACRIAAAAPGAFHARGFHPTGVLTGFGAAAAAALLLDGRSRAVREALGIVGSLGAGVMQPFVEGVDARYLHAGNAAASGLLAARLAAGGIEGSGAILEGPAGLFASHVPDAMPFDFEAVVADLGARWHSDAVDPKRYPTGFVTHPYIEAVLALGGRDREGIAAITCVVSPATAALVCEPEAEKRRPANATTARVSLYQMLAEALVHGTVDARSFSADRLADTGIRALADRIDHRVAAADASDEGEGERVIVRYEDGRPMRELPLARTGMAREDVLRKFVTNASPTVTAERAKTLARRVLRLDREADPLALLETFRSESVGEAAQIR